MRAALAACREQAGSYNRISYVLYIFEYKTQYILIHTPNTRIVVIYRHRFRRVKFVVIPIVLYSSNICEMLFYNRQLLVIRYKQRVLTPGHQGWNDLHSLCRIGLEYHLLNNDNDDDNNNNNNDDDDDDEDDDDDDDDNKNNNNNANDYNYNNHANNDNNENDNGKNSSDSMPVTV